MKKNYRIIAKSCIIMLLFFPAVLLGQNANRGEDGKLIYNWYLNGSFGLTQSYADLQSGDWHGDMLGSDEMDFGFGIRLGKHISPVFGVYGNFMSAGLEGFKEDRYLRFESDVNDYIFGVTMSFSNLIFGYSPNRWFNLYGTSGIGFASFSSTSYLTEDKTLAVPTLDGPDIGNPQDYDEGDVYQEIDQTTETMIPTGVGVDFKLSNRWDVNLESTIRWFDSDKLDGLISGTQNDAYYYTQLGVAYNFNIKFGDGLGKMKKEYDKVKLITSPSILELQGDSVAIMIKGTVPEKYFHRKAVVDFTPELVYGEQTQKLKTIKLKGEAVEGEGKVINYETGGTFTYTDKVKYVPEMDHVELWVNPVASIGNKSVDLGNRKLAEGLILTPRRIKHDENLVMTDHGYQKETYASEQAIIYYLVNRHNVNMNIDLNKQEEAVAKREELKEFIAKGWEIQKVEIDAWASPEGEESYNEGLSERRTETGKEYVANEIERISKKEGFEVKDEITYDLEHHGEDWQGFMDAVRNSDIEDKNIILNVVNSQTNLKKREQEIRNMTVIYKEIEDEILPPLRRSEIKITVYEPKLSDQQIAQFATTDPDTLTVEELLYAATMADNMDNQLDIYKTTMDQYPDNWKAYNNAAYIQIMNGNLGSAEDNLEKANNLAPNTGAITNNLGAIAAKRGNYSQAEEYFKSAQNLGVDVSYNMAIIDIRDGNYAAALNKLRSEQCDYNLALVQTLTGNTSGATTTLECADKDAQTYYLMAIVGARSGNESMIYENLKKAINEDADYKEQAKKDMEFMMYFDNPDFQNVVR